MGKQAVITVVTLIVLAIALPVCIGHIEAIYLILLIVVLVFFVGSYSIHSLCEKHPQLALMDGTEIIAYEKLQISTRESGPLKDTTPVAKPWIDVSLEPPKEEGLKK